MAGSTVAKEQVLQYRERLAEARANIPPYPTDRYAGRGIVVCAGGARYFTNAWAPASTQGRTAVEAELVATHWFDFVRVGSDQRPIELLVGNRIGTGRDDFERRWYLEYNNGVTELVFAGEIGVSCRLVRQPDGSWRGPSLILEQIPVELRPRHSVRGPELTTGAASLSRDLLTQAGLLCDPHIRQELIAALPFLTRLYPDLPQVIETMIETGTMRDREVADFLRRTIRRHDAGRS